MLTIPSLGSVLLNPKNKLRKRGGAQLQPAGRLAAGRLAGRLLAAGRADRLGSTQINKRRQRTQTDPDADTRTIYRSPTHSIAHELKKLRDSFHFHLISISLYTCRCRGLCCASGGSLALGARCPRNPSGRGDRTTLGGVMEKDDCFVGKMYGWEGENKMIVKEKNKESKIQKSTTIPTLNISPPSIHIPW